MFHTKSHFQFGMTNQPLVLQKIKHLSKGWPAKPVIMAAKLAKSLHIPKVYGTGDY
jgi:hypothetical protein